MHKLKVLRKEAGLTVAELAERTGLSKRTIWKIERGDSKQRTHVMVALRLGAALGCEVDDIFPNEDEVTHRGRPP